MVVFLEIFLPVFSALFLVMNEPKPLKYTFSPPSNEPLTVFMNSSTVFNTAAFSIPVFSEIFATMSAFVIFC